MKLDKGKLSRGGWKVLCTGKAFKKGSVAMIGFDHGVLI